MRALTFVIAFAVTFVTAFAVGRCTGGTTPGEGGGPAYVVKVDTLIRRDTVAVYKPKVVEVVKVDTMRVSVRDTLRLRDTLYLELPREQVRWSEEGVADVWASGYRPAVDSVKVYRETRVVEVEKRLPERRWGVGIQAGYGVGAGGVTPYVGVGLQYRILAF